MSGTKLGGRRARETNERKYGKNFYVDIGALGGKRGRTGGFASGKIGPDGLTGRQRAAIAGSVGGTISRRKSPVQDAISNLAIGDTTTVEMPKTANKKHFSNKYRTAAKRLSRRIRVNTYDRILVITRVE